MHTWGALPSADEARMRFHARWEPRRRREPIPTEEAWGRVLAAGVTAPEQMPPFARSLMDGIACRAADIARAPARLRLAGEVLMGVPTDLSLAPGEAARVPTGGMLPAGADVVVPIESLEMEGESVVVLAALAAGRHLIHAGEDVRAGEPLLAAGHRLRPADVAALMGLGVTQVDVYARPRVGVIATGDEIVPPDREPPPGKIRDMNSYGLRAGIESCGAVARRYGIVPDDAASLRAAGLRALEECDVLLFSAGSSVGERDLVAGVIDGLGEPGVLIHGVNIRPGKPTVFALCGATPVFGLPGQPVSVLNTFELFVAPVLRELQGLPAEDTSVTARLTAPIASVDGREDHVRVRLETRDGELTATPIAGVSAMITTLVRAQGIVVLPAASPGYAAGEKVTVRLLR